MVYRQLELPPRSGDHVPHNDRDRARSQRILVHHTLSGSSQALRATNLRRDREAPRQDPALQYKSCPQLMTRLTVLFRFAAWAFIAVLVLLTIAPPSARPDSGVPHDLEHFASFF